MAESIGEHSLSDEQLRHWPLTKLRKIFLDMGRQCNTRCIMCFQTDFSPQTRMPSFVWNEKLRPAYEVARTLAISGGEPTVLSNCRDLLKLILREYPHLKLETVTNGILFQGIWEEAFLVQGSCLNFSLNAIEPALYRRIVQFGNQEKVIENIQRMVRRKGETKSGLVIRISTVVLTETIDEIPVFVQWAVEHGLDQAIFLTDHYGGVSTKDPGRVQRRIAEAYEIADRHSSFRLIGLDLFDWHFARRCRIPPVRPRANLTATPKPCAAAFDSLLVSGAAMVKPCCWSWYVFGDLRVSSLADVWNSLNAYRFRKRMLALDFRDCPVNCDQNVRPLSFHLAQVRKGYYLLRRDPKNAVKKALRKFGLTTAQVKRSPSYA
jgi:molybdenum cofactor biosynthesis enzyme MoaA